MAGALGVLVLAEHGAEVIKVEPPEGDPYRRYSGSMPLLRSRTTATMDDLPGLVADADVVVESVPVIDWDAAHAANPSLILLSCPAYPTGHRLARRPGWDALVQATSGLMWEQPGWRPGPVFLHLPVPSIGASWLVSTGILAALSERERTGVGRHVETSLYQGALLATTQLWQEVEHGGRAYHEIMAKTYPPGIHQTMAYECANGEWLHLSIISGLTPLKSIDEVIDLPSPTDGERRARFRSLDRGMLIEAFRAANHAVEAIVPAHEILSHPQTVANGTVATVGGAAQMAVPIHLLATPGRVGVSAAARSAPPAATGVAVGAPLAGLRVVDVGQYLAGPFAPMILADLGADVVKVEPVTGDAMRGTAKAFIGCQRGKRSIALDLKHPTGHEVALRLIGGADVVHHNMTRGVATRLGIDYDACRSVRPDVIYCNTYAYGPGEPLGRFGGLDPIFQASAGIEYEAGAVAAGGDPLYLRFGLCDTANAMLSVVGVLLALVHRQRTGEGQELWTSLHDAGLYMAADAWIRSDGTPAERPHLDAGQHGLSPRYRLYETQGGGWICIAAVGDAQWARLREVVGEDVEAGFLTKTARLWHLTLDDAGVPNEIPLDTNEGEAVLHDDDNVRLGLVMEHDHAVLGTLRQFGKLLSSSTEPGPPPLVGQHSRELLREVGYRDGDIDALVGAGVIYEPDDTYRWTT